MARVLGSLSSKSSALNEEMERIKFAFKPDGGSLVNLIDLDKIPIGNVFEGSAVKKIPVN